MSDNVRCEGASDRTVALGCIEDVLSRENPKPPLRGQWGLDKSEHSKQLSLCQNK